MTKHHGCPVPEGVKHLDVKGSSHDILFIISAVSTIITLISSTTLITMHLSRYSAPKEQRQIVRIVFAPFVFALISLAEIYNYSVARYIDPVSAFYEAVCICSLFLLYVQFVAPAAVAKGTFGPDVFEAMVAKQEAGANRGNGNWPRITWVAVFQYPIAQAVAIVILEATEAAGTYCESSLKPKYGHLWVAMIQSLGVTVAIFSIVRFYSRMKVLMKARRGLAKITCFKTMVAVRFVQTVSFCLSPSSTDSFFRECSAGTDDVPINQWIFNILIDKDVVKTSDRFSYGDLTYGLPNTLMCIECIIFSGVFWYAFSSTEYGCERQQQQQRLTVWKAALHSMSPWDIFHGVARAAGLVVGRRQNGQDDLDKPVPITRSGRGRYRTLEVDDAAASGPSHVPLQQTESLGFGESSPPRYGELPSCLQPVAARYGDRSPSPGTLCERYEVVRGRDIV